MDNDRSRRWLVRVNLIFGGTVFQVEALGQLEVELYCGALEGTTQRITDFDIDLRPVESAISRVQFPLARVLSIERLG